MILFICLALSHIPARAELLHGPVRVNDIQQGNSIGHPGTSRNIAIDPEGRIHVVYSGTNGIRLASSTDRGGSFAPTIQVSQTNAETAIACDSSGRLYLAWMEAGNQVMFSMSTNQTSFSTPRAIGEVTASSVHLAVDHPHVYVLPRPGGILLRNALGGSGAFSSSTVDSSERTFSDVIVNPHSRAVHVESDDPNIRYFASTNHGASFHFSTNTGLRSYHPSVAGIFDTTRSYLFVGGRSNIIYRFDLENHAVTTIPSISSRDQGRALASDPVGNLVDAFLSSTGAFYRVSTNAGSSFSSSTQFAGFVDSISVGINTLYGDLVTVFQDNGQIFCTVYANELLCTNIDVRVTGAVLPERVRPGAEIVYSLQITNASPVSAPDVVVSNRLPAGISYLGGSSNWVDQGGGLLTCTIGDMAPRAGYELSITGLVSLSASGALSNRTTATLSARDIFPNNNTLWLHTLVSPLLQVVNPRSISVPAAGTYTNDLGTEVFVTNESPHVAGSTQYICTGWTLAGNAPASGTSNNFSFVHTNDAVLTWRWGITNVTFMRSAGANGSVSGAATGLYAIGSSVVVTAQPNPHYHFAYWSGKVPSGQAGQNPLTLTLDQSRTIVAYFGINTHTLTVQSTVGGVAPAAGTHTRNYNQAISCTATSPLVFYGGTPHGVTQYFSTGWSMTGNAPASGTTNSFSMNLTNSATLAWLWSTPQVRLQVAHSAGGSVQGSSGWAWLGATTNLTANPDEHYQFIGWTGNVPAAMTNQASIALPMDQWRSVTANFTGVEREVVVSSPHGTPSPAVGVHSYLHNQNLSASVNSPVSIGTTQYVCTGWTLTGHAPGTGTGTSLSRTITNNAHLTWHWRTNMYLRVATSGPGSVSGASTGWYPLGTNLTLHALPETGQTPFLHWSGDAPGLPAADNPLLLALSRPYSVTAHFQHCEATLEVASDYGTPSPGVGQHSRTCGASISPSVNAFVELGGVRYACTGWSMSGNAPTSGTTNQFSMSLTNDYALLVWHWEPVAYYLDIEIVGSGGVSGTTPGWYALNTPISLFPGPVPDGVFLRWELDVPPGQEHDDPLDFILDRSRTIRAVFTDVYRTIEVHSAYGAPSPSGTTSNLYGSSVSCSVSSPVAGAAGIRYACSGWTISGNAPASGSTPAFTLESHTNHATLTWLWHTSYYFSVSAPPPGSASGTSSGWYAQGTGISVEAHPPTGYRFSHWSGTVPPGQHDQNPLLFDLDAPYSITAEYELAEHELSILSAHGTPDPPVGIHTRQHGLVMTNRVSPSLITGATTQFLCTGWAMNGNNPAAGTTNLLIMTITNDAALTWSWATNVLLNLAVQGAGEITGDTGGWSRIHQTNELLAVPGTGMAFSHWSGNVPTAQTNLNPLPLLMDRTRSVTGHFELARHTLTILSPYGTGSPPAGIHTGLPWGTVLTNAMTPAHVVPGGTQYVLSGWTMNHQPASGATNSFAMTITNDAILNWTWTTNVQLTWTNTGIGQVRGAENQWYPLGGSVTITAAPGENYQFDNWSLDVPAAQTNQQAITLPMDRARHVRANFSLILVRDFVIESMGVHSSPDRNTVIAQVQIGNLGTDAGDAGLLTAWINRSTPALCGEVGDVSIEPGILEPGESRLFIFTNLNPGVASGMRTFRAFVDARCESVETEERNNQAACNYTYLGPVLKRFTFNAVALTDSVMLRWSAPTNSGLPNNMVRLLFKTNEYPGACDDGELIYNGPLQHHHHTNRTPGESCYYGIFVNDGTYYIDPPDF